MRLYIAEKKEVATALAEAIGNPTLTGGPAYLVGHDRITWLRGHLLRLTDPDEHDEKLKTWSLDDLPMSWPISYRPVGDRPGQGQLDAVIAFIKQADELVNVGDPDPEGQRLVDEVIEYAGAQGKPAYRLLINDNSDAAIRRSLERPEDNAQYRGLSLAALARSVCDQRYGYNLTRAYTLLGRQQGYEGVLSVGRVQTPILGLVVRRDRAHEAHEKKAFYNLFAQIRIEKAGAALTARARYQPPEDAPTDGQGRIVDVGFLKAIASSIAGQAATVKEVEIKETEELPPLPHNLLSLQAEAAGTFGYKPGKVLETTQGLRDRHKAITYNRSDCRYLNDERYEEAPGLLPRLALLYPETDLDAPRKSRAFDSSRVTVHHAIIPTANVPDWETLSGDAASWHIYDLIARAYIAQFHPPAKLRTTTVRFQVDAHRFRATETVIVAPGWRAVCSAETAAGEEPEASTGLEKLAARDAGTVDGQEVKKEFTRPPARYTMKTLLRDLTRVSKYVEDPAIRKLLLEKDAGKEDEQGGIGTPATRDQHLETLFTRGYVEEKAKKLVSTKLGRDFHDALPEFATRPDMTALWHAEQKRIESNELGYEEFVESVEQTIAREVQRVTAEGLALRIDAAPCPRCQAGALRRRQGRNGAFWGCSRYPDCKAAYPEGKDGKPDLSGGVAVSTEHRCPKCDQGLIRREAKNGGKPGAGKGRRKGAEKRYWWGCSGFPACDYRAFDEGGRPKSASVSDAVTARLPPGK